MIFFICIMLFGYVLVGGCGLLVVGGFVVWFVVWVVVRLVGLCGLDLKVVSNQ